MRPPDGLSRCFLACKRGPGTMVPLNEYEACQADEIAAWKSERPSLVMAAFRGLSRPLSRLAAKIVPDGTIRRVVAKAERCRRSSAVRKRSPAWPASAIFDELRELDARGMRPPGSDHQHARRSGSDDRGGHRRTRRSCHRDTEHPRALDRGAAVGLQDRVLLRISTGYRDRPAVRAGDPRALDGR